MRRLRFPALLVAILTAIPGCSPRPKAEERSYNMGDRVELGHLVYNVFDTQWLTQLGDGPSARVPAHRFFLVRMSVFNGGSADAMLPSVVLVDDQRQTHGEITNGDAVPQWMGFLRRIKPVETLQGNVVFDVPPAHYRIRLADENDERAALIDLPLTFGSETPAVPQGEEQK